VVSPLLRKAKSIKHTKIFAYIVVCMVMMSCVAGAADSGVQSVSQTIFKVIAQVFCSLLLGLCDKVIAPVFSITRMTVQDAAQYLPGLDATTPTGNFLIQAIQIAAFAIACVLVLVEILKLIASLVKDDKVQSLKSFFIRMFIFVPLVVPAKTSYSAIKVGNVSSTLIHGYVNLGSDTTVFCPILRVLYILFNNVINPISNAFADGALAAQTTDEGFLSQLLSGSGLTDGDDFTSIILATVFMVMIGTQLISLVAEAAERYLMCIVLIFMSPLAFSAGVSSGTEQVAKNWFRMFWSHSVLLVLNIWIVGIARTAFTSSMCSSNFLVWALITYSFLKVAQKLDDMMANSGLLLTRTGGDFMKDFMGAWALTKSAVKDAKNTISGVSKIGGAAAERIEMKKEYNSGKTQDTSAMQKQAGKQAQRGNLAGAAILAADAAGTKAHQKNKADRYLNKSAEERAAAKTAGKDISLATQGAKDAFRGIVNSGSVASVTKNADGSSTAKMADGSEYKLMNKGGNLWTATKTKNADGTEVKNGAEIGFTAGSAVDPTKAAKSFAEKAGTTVGLNDDVRLSQDEKGNITGTTVQRDESGKITGTKSFALDKDPETGKAVPRMTSETAISADGKAAQIKEYDDIGKPGRAFTLENKGTDDSGKSKWDAKQTSDRFGNEMPDMGSKEFKFKANEKAVAENGIAAVAANAFTATGAADELEKHNVNTALAQRDVAKTNEKRLSDVQEGKGKKYSDDLHKKATQDFLANDERFAPFISSGGAVAEQHVDKNGDITGTMIKRDENGAIVGSKNFVIGSTSGENPYDGKNVAAETSSYRYDKNTDKAHFSKNGEDYTASRVRGTDANGNSVYKVTNDKNPDGPYARAVVAQGNEANTSNVLYDAFAKGGIANSADKNIGGATSEYRNNSYNTEQNQANRQNAFSANDEQKSPIAGASDNRYANAQQNGIGSAAPERENQERRYAAENMFGSQPTAAKETETAKSAYGTSPEASQNSNAIPGQEAGFRVQEGGNFNGSATGSGNNFAGKAGVETNSTGTPHQATEYNLSGRNESGAAATRDNPARGEQSGQSAQGGVSGNSAPAGNSYEKQFSERSDFTEKFGKGAEATSFHQTENGSTGTWEKKDEQGKVVAGGTFNVGGNGISEGASYQKNDDGSTTITTADGNQFVAKHNGFFDNYAVTNKETGKTEYMDIYNTPGASTEEKLMNAVSGEKNIAGTANTPHSESAAPVSGNQHAFDGTSNSASVGSSAENAGKAIPAAEKPDNAPTEKWEPASGGKAIEFTGANNTQDGAAPFAGKAESNPTEEAKPFTPHTASETNTVSNVSAEPVRDTSASQHSEFTQPASVEKRGYEESSDKRPSAPTGEPISNAEQVYRNTGAGDVSHTVQTENNMSAREQSYEHSNTGFAQESKADNNAVGSEASRNTVREAAVPDYNVSPANNAEEVHSVQSGTSPVGVGGPTEHSFAANTSGNAEPVRDTEFAEPVNAASATSGNHASAPVFETETFTDHGAHPTHTDAEPVNAASSARTNDTSDPFIAVVPEDSHIAMQESGRAQSSEGGSAAFAAADAEPMFQPASRNDNEVVGSNDAEPSFRPADDNAGSARFEAEHETDNHSHSAPTEAGDYTPHASGSHREETFDDGMWDESHESREGGVSTHTAESARETTHETAVSEGAAPVVGTVEAAAAVEMTAPEMQAAAQTAEVAPVTNTGVPETVATAPASAEMPAAEIHGGNSTASVDVNPTAAEAPAQPAEPVTATVDTRNDAQKADAVHIEQAVVNASVDTAAKPNERTEESSTRTETDNTEIRRNEDIPSSAEQQRPVYTGSSDKEQTDRRTERTPDRQSERRTEQVGQQESIPFTTEKLNDSFGQIHYGDDVVKIQKGKFGWNVNSGSGWKRNVTYRDDDGKPAETIEDVFRIFAEKQKPQKPRGDGKLGKDAK